MNTAAAARALLVSRSIISRISSRPASEKLTPRLMRLAASGIRLFSTISPACSRLVVKARISVSSASLSIEELRAAAAGDPGLDHVHAPNQERNRTGKVHQGQGRVHAARSASNAVYLAPFIRLIRPRPPKRHTAFALPDRLSVGNGTRSPGTRDVIEPMQPLGKPTGQTVRRHRLDEFARGHQLTCGLTLRQCTAQPVADLRSRL